MLNKVLTYYFFFSIVVSSTIYLAQKQQIKIPSLVNNYVNDFLIVPIVLILSLWLVRKVRESKHYQFPLWIVLYVALSYSIIFEYILPQFYDRYTADVVDVILYFTSGFLFYILQKLK